MFRRDCLRYAGLCSKKRQPGRYPHMACVRIDSAAPARMELPCAALEGPGRIPGTEAPEFRGRCGAGQFECLNLPAAPQPSQATYRGAAVRIARDACAAGIEAATGAQSAQLLPRLSRSPASPTTRTPTRIFHNKKTN